MIPRRLFLVSIILISISNLYAQIPRTLSYQAVLTDIAGVPKPDGAYVVTFRLYTVVSGGVALWTESQTLQVKRGLFSAVLGSVTPFGANLTFAQPYWLSLQVAPDAEMSPRLPLTSTGYSLAPWTSIGSDVYFSGGLVGIGTVPNPLTGIRLDVNGQTRLAPGGSGGVIQFGTPSSETGMTIIGTNRADIRFDGSSLKLLAALGNSGPPDSRNGIVINTSGNVGIGNSNPTVRLSVGGGVVADTKIEINAGGDQYAGLRIRNNQRAFNWQVVPSADVPGGRLRLTEEFSGLEMISVTTTGLGLGTTNPTARLEVIGRTKTGTLEITAGSDLAEPFDTETDEVVEPGSIMVIDAMNAGKLKVSELPYDAKVAGIVSGAAGVKPGITLQQEGVLEGKSLVAIAGRVYCKADANEAPIEPGDLLTTSSIPGHAMKATDKNRSHGAIIGKAMSSLKAGTGLVLVLVNLQ